MQRPLPEVLALQVVDVGLKFQVRWPSGKVETLLVDAPSALIGTAGHCEVRLPIGAGAHEHVEVIAMDGGVHVATLGNASPPQIDGYPLVAGSWPHGSVLTIADVAMTVEPVDLRDNVKRRSPFWALLPVPFIAIAALLARNSTGGEAQIPPAPPLFDAPIAVCPAPNSPTLTAFAAERARIGYAKRERSPFFRGDGIEAVGLLETAASCFHVVGRLDEERETRTAANDLRIKLDEEFRTRRVRLEHAAKVRDAVAAKRELRSILPLVAHRDGPYIEWLAAKDRWATARIAELDARPMMH